MRLTVRVPATSANLGPGFDCFGLALDLMNAFTVDTDGEPGVTWEGEGAEELPIDGSDMTSRAMAFAATEAGGSLPPLHLHGVNAIPLERGLGSSSSAAVAGVMLAAHLLHPHASKQSRLFHLATRLEGHPDNAAAAIYGGFTLAPQDGPVVRLEPHLSLRPVVLIPHTLRLSTAEARRALVSSVPRQDAVYNVSHAAVMVVALTQRPELLPIALRDRLHQDARLALIPEVRDVFDTIASSGVPVALSGAGPALLAFDADGAPVPDPGEGWRVLRPAVRAEGAQLSEG